MEENIMYNYTIDASLGQSNEYLHLQIQYKVSLVTSTCTDSINSYFKALWKKKKKEKKTTVLFTNRQNGGLDIFFFAHSSIFSSRGCQQINLHIKVLQKNINFFTSFVSKIIKSSPIGKQNGWFSRSFLPQLLVCFSFLIFTINIYNRISFERL